MLGHLVKKHYPSLITIDGIQKPPNKWPEFYKVKDADEVPLADVIKREFWVSLHRTALLMCVKGVRPLDSWPSAT